LRASKATAMLVVKSADRLGDDGLKTQAILLARALEREKWDEAGAILRGFAKPKVDREVLKAALPKLTAAEVGAAFRSKRLGGLNIDHDLQAQLKAADDIQLIELLAV